MSRHDLDFYIGPDKPVGHFLGPGFPVTAGRFEYDPYRGEGHAELAQALDSGRGTRCWFTHAGKQELVLGEPGTPGHWYLDIAEFA